METQAYNPHLKKVLKTYQLSAVKSLQGPSTVLESASVSSAGDVEPTTTAASTTSAGDEVAVTPVSSPAPVVAASSPPATSSTAAVGDPFLYPPPFPIQQIPILTAPDQGGAERAESVLEGETIACFVVGGEKRLCLPQVLNSVLRDFSLAQINAVCDDLQIFCSRCNPEQLEALQSTGILPDSAPSCGLITQTDAERLCASLLPRGLSPAKEATPPKEALPLKVYHKCFGKCYGVIRCSGDAPLERVIECLECHLVFRPQHFVSHSHNSRENRTVHWGFDSTKWRSYLQVTPDQADSERCSKLLERFKTRPSSRHKRKQESSSSISHTDGLSSKAERGVDRLDLDETVLLKKARLDAADAAVAAAAAAAAANPAPPPAAFVPFDPYMYWYEMAALSAFRPWPTLLAASKDGKPTPPPPPLPILRDSMLPALPPYLSHGPPVLLHPERVVPLSECQRFERSFQPNVALAPFPSSPHRTKSLERKQKDKKDSTAVEKGNAESVDRTPPISPAKRSETPPPSTTPVTTITITPNPNVNGKKVPSEIEVSSDTDDSASESDATNAGTGTVNAGVDNSVAAMLESLSSDEKDARMASVLRSLANRLGAVEAERGRLGEENEALRRRAQEQEALILQQERAIQRLQEQQDRLHSKHDPEAFQDKMMAMEKELRTLRSEVNRIPVPNVLTNGLTDGLTDGLSSVLSGKGLSNGLDHRDINFSNTTVSSPVSVIHAPRRTEV